MIWIYIGEVPLTIDTELLFDTPCKVEEQVIDDWVMVFGKTMLIMESFVIISVGVIVQVYVAGV